MKMRTIITILILGVGIYFLFKGSIILGVILTVWAMLRFYGYSFNQLERGISSLVRNSGKLEKTNLIFNVSLNITGILASKKMKNLFHDLKKKGFIHFENYEAFIKEIQDSYKKKFKNDSKSVNEETGESYDVSERVNFNIKNNILWKNEKVEFADIIWHELFIPYKYNEREEESFFGQIKQGIKIRFLIVNGLLKLQVGRFDKSSSPKIIKDDGLAIYLDWLNITTFPLMYITQLFPETYLNLSMYATESFVDYGKEGVDWSKDWKDLNSDIIKYNKIFNLTDDDELSSHHMEFLSLFNKKAEKYILEDGFIDNKRTDDSWYPGWLDDNSISYTNEYLTIYINDLNDYKERFKKYYALDRYEERP